MTRTSFDQIYYYKKRPSTYEPLLFSSAENFLLYKIVISVLIFAFIISNSFTHLFTSYKLVERASTVSPLRTAKRTTNYTSTIMPFFSSIFSSSTAGSSSRTKNSHLKRFINNVTKPSQYVPDIYDEFRDEGFYFRPSDTYTSTAISSPTAQTSTHTQASQSTPNLHHNVPAPSADDLCELASLPVPRRPVTGYKHSNEVNRESVISFASSVSAISNETADTSAEVHELATLPATVYTPPPPRRSSLAAARQHTLGRLAGDHAASTPCLPLELDAEEKSARRPATAKAHVQYRNSVGDRFITHFHAHAPARPSPLKLATITARRPSEDVPIMLSPRTAAFQKALPLLPLASCPVTPGSGSGVAFKRKPVPSTPVVGEGLEIVKLPVEAISAPAELDSGDELMMLPGLPSRLSRLETLRYRLSLVDPSTPASPPLDNDVIVSHTKNDLKRNFSIRTYHSTLLLADLNRMGALGAVARRKRHGSASSDDSVDIIATKGEFEPEEAVEVGTAKVIGAVSGVVGRAKMVGFADSESSESEYEADVMVAGRVVKSAKGGDKRKSMGRERQRVEGVVGWWHTRGE